MTYLFKSLKDVILTPELLDERTELIEKDIAWNKGIPTEEQHWYGRQHKESSKKKTSEAMKNRHAEKPKTHTQETKDKIRNSLKGHKHSAETKEKLRIAALKRYNK